MVYIHAFQDKEGMTYALCSLDCKSPNGSSYYASVETSHPAEVMDYLKDFTSDSPSYTGLKGYSFGPDNLISFIRQFIWKTYREQGIISLSCVNDPA